ncbi:MAG: translation initiation factor IF-2 [Candidatus Parcubacteria bacterium]|nr:translation initiation factor IF-2 [Candidatus Parcubacteria bacterium]
MKKTEKKNLIIRPPVVVVMGHIDHGKTTLLDYIRKTKVAEKESGAITQHIGAYELEVKLPNSDIKRKVTFLDTPGHEAFTEMRERGAWVADIGILVVAADEGVKIQTKEAIDIILKTKLPFLVAINKIDKSEANVEKVKRELSENGVMVEGWGGQVPCLEISAKNGQGVDQLLEMIALMAEMEDLKANPCEGAQGVVIESYLDSHRGYTATLLILSGTLRKGDDLILGKVTGKIKVLENFRGEPMEDATFSSPVIAVGFNDLPQVGQKFYAGDQREYCILGENEKIVCVDIQYLGEDECVEKIPLVIKADVLGSIEALISTLTNLSKELNVKFVVIKNEVGDIGETDYKLAETSGAIILGFRVKIRPELKVIISNSNTIVLVGDTIYELSDNLKKDIVDKRNLKDTRVVIGKLKVLAIYNNSKGDQVIGGEVIEGKLEKKGSIDILRGEEKIGCGTIVNLQLNKTDMVSVSTPNKCGLVISTKMIFEVGDILEYFKIEKH